MLLRFSRVATRVATIVAGAVSLSCLPGCGQNGDGAKPATQVAARVNGGEITLYRVNSALATASGAMDGRDPQALAQARHAVLDSLVDQELAAQAAEENKLDRTPAVVQAIEAARREVLARAWLDQLSTAQPKASGADVSRYYADHPELFAQRRVYNVEQIVLPLPEPALLKQLRDQVGANASSQQIDRWLDQKQLRHSTASGARAAEQIPLDILAQMSKAKDGQTVLIEQPRAVMVVHIVSSVLQPVEEAAATPRIQKFLANQAWTDAIATEMKRLKQNASITYLGEFSTVAQGVSATPGTPAASAASNGIVPTSAVAPEKTVTQQ